MRVELTDTQRQLRDTVRAFAAARVRPAAAETDRRERFPRELVAELARLGVMGCFVPERYGGAGFDYVAYALAVEELSAACAATGVIFSAHASLATWPILALGTEAQRQRYLPKLARGEWLGCFALSEPSSGSDAGSIRTTARRTGEHYVLNGTKNFITNAPDAQLAIGLAAQAVGIARACVEDSLAYARERRAFGRALAEFQAAQFRLADMATAVEAARLLTLHAAFLKDRGLPYTKEAAMAKLFAAETAMTLATQAVQMHGGYGYTREFAVERYFRDAKITEIYEGTSEIQRLVIAGQLIREAGGA